MQITPRPNGLITASQAAALCGVSPITIRQWANRGYQAPDGSWTSLPVAKREGRTVLYRPVDVAKAEFATRGRARRQSRTVLAAAA